MKSKREMTHYVASNYSYHHSYTYIPTSAAIDNSTLSSIDETIVKQSLKNAVDGSEHTVTARQMVWHSTCKCSEA